MDKRDPNYKFGKHSYEKQSEFSDGEMDDDNRSIGQDEQFEDSILFDKRNGQSTPLAPSELELSRDLSMALRNRVKHDIEQAIKEMLFERIRENKVLKRKKSEMIIFKLVM